jgi:threonine/homoserine/homoserine lactone efflux protein
VIDLVLFLGSVIIISCSGVMAPGPITAAAITLGTKNKYAGTFFAIGHGLIELPLIILIVFGYDHIRNSPIIINTIGLIGGCVLLWMAFGLFKDAKDPDYKAGDSHSSRPVLAGLILSASNPYFLLWWLSVGLKLATQAQQLGVFAFILFTAVHWLCDLIWFQLLSFASYKGAKVMSPKILRTILGLCALAMTGFGVFFIYDSVSTWLG